MNNFVIDTPDNFWQIRWLDKYMEGHKGFIAGGCFKNILSGERVKDIDIFFESESDFQEAIDSFNDEKHQKEGWKFKYRNFPLLIVKQLPFRVKSPCLKTKELNFSGDLNLGGRLANFLKKRL